MPREWVDPSSGAQVLEDGEEEYVHPAAAAQLQEDQPAAGAEAEITMEESVSIYQATDMIGY